MRLAFSSDGPRPLSDLLEGESGIVVHVAHDDGAAACADRLLALGVTPGAPIRVLQTFPGVVFICDQTELVVERAIAHAILVRTAEALS